jgi:hypothetical protein
LAEGRPLLADEGVAHCIPVHLNVFDRFGKAGEVKSLLMNVESLLVFEHLVEDAFAGSLSLEATSNLSQPGFRTMNGLRLGTTGLEDSVSVPWRCAELGDNCESGQDLNS